MGGTESKEPAKPRTGPNVYLNVYTNGDGKSPNVPGFGIYHSGMQIFNTEYTFAGGDFDGCGIQEQTPKATPSGSQWIYSQTIDLGPSDLSEAEVRSVLANIRSDFPARKYDLLGRNCNHFTEILATRLNVNKSYPSWVNRAAKWGGSFKGGGVDPVALEKRRIEDQKYKAAAAEKEKSLLKQKQSTLKAEPPMEADGVVEVQINCPNGTKTKRRFLNTDTIQDVMNFAISFDLTIEAAKFWLRINMPRTIFDKPKQTLKEAGFTQRENLFIEKKR